MGKGRRKRERKKCQCMVTSHTPPTGDLAHSPGMCPDWESNQRSLGLQASAPLSHTSWAMNVIFMAEGIWQM